MHVTCVSRVSRQQWHELLLCVSVLHRAPRFTTLSGQVPLLSWVWVMYHLQVRFSTFHVSYAGFRLAYRSPLCHYAAWSSLAVSELQLSAAMPLWLYHRAASLPSWIEFNCLRSAAVGKAARLSIYWHDAACRLIIPLRQVALAQLYKNHHHSSNVASGKLVWNQHYDIHSAVYIGVALW